MSDRSGPIGRLRLAQSAVAPAKRKHPINKHRYLWEQLNGPVPEGHVLKCLDGNKLDTDPSNWVAIPRALLPRLNGRWSSLKYDDAPEELKPTLMLMAKIKHAAAEAKQRA